MEGSPQNEVELEHAGQPANPPGDNNDSGQPTVAQKPSKKRKKGDASDRKSEESVVCGKGRRSAGRKAGKLRNLPEMPLDILFEIFSNLHPLDLLHLARATKALRNMLMQRSARHIWKNTLESLEGLPECPPQLSEPLYIALSFDPICSFCAKASVKTVFWVLRVRCCKNCRDKHMIKWLSSYIGPDTWNFWARLTLPVQIIRVKTRRHSDRWYLKDMVIKFRAEVKRDAERVKAQLDQKSTERRSIEEHAARCEAWHTAQMQNRKDELGAARERRLQAILLKLKDAGWAETLDNMLPLQEEHLKYHALVRQPKDLSDRIWANIKDGLTEFMQKLRSEQLEKARFDLLAKRVQIVKDLRSKLVTGCPGVLSVPSTADICFMKEFKSIIELPSEVIVTEDIFSDAAEQLPELCARWKEATQKKLVELLPPLQGIEAPSDAERLSLATSAFKCTFCGSIMDSNIALDHRCLISYTRHHSNKDKLPADSDRHGICSSAEGIPWGAGNMVQFAPHMLDTIRLFVEACGKDPTSTTWEEMDRLDARFTRAENESLIMSWRAAFVHDYRPSSSSDNPNKTIRLIGDSTKLHAIWAEEQNRWGLECIWRCSMCNAAFAFADLQPHVDSRHGITVLEKRHYYRCPRLPWRYSSWVFTQPPTTQQNAGNV